jgi:hypothetical protein
MKPIRVSLAPITVVVGIALIGNGIDGSIGAGVALMAVVVVGFLVALVLVDDETNSVGRRCFWRPTSGGDAAPRKSSGAGDARRPSGISCGAGINGESEQRICR